MRSRKLAAALVAGAALAGTVATAAPASAFGGEGIDTIAEALVGKSGAPGSYDRNPFDYDILISAAVASGLAGAVTSPDTAVTVFAPNDLAFRQLLVDLTGQARWLWAGEAEVFGRLAGIVTNPANNVGSASLLDTVLGYHVVPAVIDSATALNADGAVLGTFQGGTFEVDVVNRSLPLVVLQDADTDDLDAVLAQTRLDIDAGNSIVHGVTQVLRPADVGRVFEFRGTNLPVVV